MPGDSGELAVNTHVHFCHYVSHTRLRAHRAPGIPRALLRVAPRAPFQGEEIPHNSGVTRYEAANTCLK
jgi:hypothetical protein